jgi:CBS domain-containing protein
MTVADVMTPFSASLELNPRDDALSAITLLAKAGVNQLPVTENGQMCGLLRREDVLKWVSLYEDVDVHPAAMVGR